jgi:hypothetical protein
MVAASLPCFYLPLNGPLFILIGKQKVCLREGHPFQRSNLKSPTRPGQLRPRSGQHSTPSIMPCVFTDPTQDNPISASSLDLIGTPAQPEGGSLWISPATERHRILPKPPLSTHFLPPARLLPGSPGEQRPENAFPPLPRPLPPSFPFPAPLHR